MASINGIKKYLRSKKIIFFVYYQVKNIIHIIMYKSRLIQRFNYYEYHNIPFDTSLPMPGSAGIVLEDACKTLSDLDISYTLGWGTALGLYRDKALISHDTDIDVDVYNLMEPQTLIIEMIKHGHSIGRYVSFKNSKTEPARVQQLTFYSTDNVVFDILFWYDNNTEYLTNYSERNHVLTYDKSFLTQTRLFEYGGYQYRVPRDTERYLRSLYGKSWKVPKTQKGDWKDDCQLIQLNS